MVGMPRARPLARLALVVFVLSTGAGFYFATQLHFAYPEPFRRPWREALEINLVHYWIWGLLAPLILLAARRRPFSRSTWGSALPVHVALGLALTAVQIGAAQLTLNALGAPSSGAVLSLAKALRTNFHSSLPTYWLVLAVVHAVDYYAKYRDREVRASQLEARLAEARLAALKRQMNPHFLFNTLNSISALMYVDPNAADAMLARLSELLRLALDADGEQEVPLARELALLSRYLEIEKIRFEDRLRIEVDVAPALLDARVPALSLQPLAENAIRHGIARRPEGGTLRVRAARDAGANGHLRLTVEDDGTGLPSEEAKDRGDGIGLGNLRARLEELYGQSQRLALAGRPGGGAVVEITIPFRTGETLGEAPRADRR
jgi:two-component system, LytTR family, sensor kinase